MSRRPPSSTLFPYPTLVRSPRAPGAGVLAEGLVEQPGARRDLAVGDRHVDPLVAQDPQAAPGGLLGRVVGGDDDPADPRDRKSTRLNSSHANISYAVFCLKK